MIEPVLKKFGLHEKEIAIYLALLKLGSAPVRTIAQHAGINRTTTHEILNKLIDEGLASFVEKERHRYFTTEPPEHFLHSLAVRKQGLVQLEQDIGHILPELKSRYEKSESKPKAKYFEGETGLRAILEDVLATTGRDSNKQYYVYSSSTIRDTLYQVFPNYNDERKKRNISVQTISIGPGGGLHGLDERKWLSREEGAPTYTLLYSGKVAHISLGENNEIMGVVVEDKNSYATQVMVFKVLWKKL